MEIARVVSSENVHLVDTTQAVLSQVFRGTHSG